MQAAKEYDLQFNNILKKEEYKKYVAAHRVRSNPCDNHQQPTCI
jgi:hypothetical protein